MNPNSAQIWLPKIQYAGLPVPRTIIVPYDHGACMSIFDDKESAEFRRVCELLSRAGAEIGYPVFLRTDLGSAKHAGPKAYRLDYSAAVVLAAMRTIEDQEMKFWTERFGPAAFLVREFLDLDAPFAAFGGLPIAREWRIFADAERIWCTHAYWPAECLNFYTSDPPASWHEDLAALHVVPTNMPDLKRMAMEASRACGGGRWNVDFAYDQAGKPWLIDMAQMADSWHWPGCPNGEVGAFAEAV